MWRIVAVVLLLCGTASAKDWEHNNKIQPGENRNYLMTSTEASGMLDGRRCGTMSFAWERDIEGSQVIALASLYACPKADSAQADCTLHTAFIDDAFEVVSTHRPGFWLVDTITAPTGDAVARIAAYCGSQLVSGGGGSATRFCNISVESATLTDDIMCGKATTDLTLVSLTCRSTSAATVLHKVELFTCNDVGGLCTTATGLTVTLDAAEQEVDITLTDATVDALDWFMLDTVSIGGTPPTPAAWLHCQVEYTE